MNMRISSLVATLALAAALNGMPAQAQNHHNNGNDRYEREQVCDYCGTVRSISRISSASRRNNTGATLLGAIIGGALGNQVGKGDGRRAATVAGAVAGGVVGHNSGGNNHRRTYYRISVRMDSGRFYTIDQRSTNGLRSGNRVEIRDGEVVRLR